MNAVWDTKEYNYFSCDIKNQHCLMDKFWVHLAQLFWEVRSSCSSQKWKIRSRSSVYPRNAPYLASRNSYPTLQNTELILHTNLSASSAYQSFSCVSKIPILLCALCAFLVLFAVKYYSQYATRNLFQPVNSQFSINCSLFQLPKICHLYTTIVVIK